MGVREFFIKKRLAKEIEKIKTLLKKGEAEKFLEALLSLLSEHSDLEGKLREFLLEESVKLLKRAKERFVGEGPVYRRVLEELVKLAPDDEVKLELAVCLAKERVVSEDAFQLYKFALEKDPDNFPVLKFLGNFAVDNDREDMVEYVERLLKLDPKWKKGKTYLARKRLRERREDKESLKLYWYLYRLGKIESGDEKKFLAELSLKLGKYDEETYKLLRELVLEAKEEDLVPALASLARKLKLMDSKLHTHFLKYMKEKEERDEGWKEVVRALGEHYLALGKKGEAALALYFDWFSFDKDPNLAAFLAEELRRRKKKDALAKSVYLEVFKNSPDDTENLFYLAEILAEDPENLKDEEWRVLKESFKRGHDLPSETVLALAFKCLEGERLDDTCRKVLVRAIKEYPDVGDLVEGLARFLIDEELRDEEVEALLLGFDLIPDSEEKKRLAERLYRFCVDNSFLDERIAELYDYLISKGVKPQLPVRFLSRVAAYMRKKGRKDAVAVEVYRRLFEENPGDFNNLTYLGDLLAKNGCEEEWCLRVYEECLKKGVVLEGGLRVLVEKYVESGRKDEFAVNVFSEAVARGVFDFSNVENLKRALYYAFLRGKYEVVVKGCEKFFEKGGDDEFLKRLYVRSLVYGGEVEKGEEAMRTLPLPEWEREFLKGVLSFEKGDYSRALQHFNKVSDGEQLELRKLFSSLETGGVSVDEVERKENEFSQKEVFYNNLAVFLAERGEELRRAVELVEKALSRDSGEKVFKENLAKACWRLSRSTDDPCEKAILLKRALEMEPYNKSLWRNGVETFLLAALHCAGKGDYEGVKRWCGEVNRWNYKEMRSKLLRGVVAVKEGKIEEAKVNLEAVLRAEPHSPLGNYHMALAKKTEGDWVGGIKCLEKVENREVVGDNYWLLYGDLLLSVREKSVAEYSDSVFTPRAREDGRLSEIALTKYLASDHKGVLDLACEGGKVERFEDVLCNFIAGYSAYHLEETEALVNLWYSNLNVNAFDFSFRERKVYEDVLLQQAMVFFDLDMPQQARETLERIKAVNPANDKADYLLSLVEFAEGYKEAKGWNLTRAIFIWEKVYEKGGEANWDLIQNLAIAYTASKDLIAARHYWNKMMDYWEKRKAKEPGNPIYEVYLTTVRDTMELLLKEREPSLDPLTRLKIENAYAEIERFNRYYWFLGLKKFASYEDVEKAYVKMVRKFTPEKNPEEFMLIEEAYGALRDPQVKHRIDVFVFNPIRWSNVYKVIGVENMKSMENGVRNHWKCEASTHAILPREADFVRFKEGDDPFSEGLKYYFKDRCWRLEV